MGVTVALSVECNYHFVNFLMIFSKESEADTSYKKYRQDDEDFDQIDDIHDDQQRLHTSSLD